MARRSFNGSAVPTTMSGSISNSVTAVPVTDGSTYPDGSGAPFFVVLDKGLVGEEKIPGNTPGRHLLHCRQLATANDQQVAWQQASRLHPST